MASNLQGSKCEIKVFDSLYTSVHKDTQKIILNLFETRGKTKLKVAEMSTQEGVNDCGVFAIAAATVVAFGLRCWKRKVPEAIHIQQQVNTSNLDCGLQIRPEWLPVVKGAQ